ncbi:CDP-glucose 4,6-dehydratase [Azorhizobium oxalatiphilum]|uniref:CDP-glucose 4,6-dehydratase n=1 Tax=Azorhizobium oxalatiphilum TaxID=980631 RepID=A0A917BKE4_9HYPH|nr:CDP-glucose 4,6-dehydratase [Azorhizobium oxalatiphilum]GGF49371.1 CDP-glucose 4,6-dehydratase [Azorhizobium oxalatiphilum]
MGVSGFWAGRRVLVTGHTGFKGAWLCLWLERLGAQVSALALAPDTQPALYEVLGPWAGQSHAIVDIRDRAALAGAVEEVQPQIVLHLAAQALVRRSYADPVETFATNIMGTVNLLEAVRGVPGVEAVVVATTDKVYANDNAGRPFSEDDTLGGKDPYSNSKACAELVTQSYRDSFFRDHGAKIATARAGNVIGGGDWSLDRLVPDFVRALGKGEPVRLRYPDSVRPWQHVLEPLSGYLTLAQALVERPDAAPKAVNFGPDPESFASVAQVADGLGVAFGMETAWLPSGGVHPPEASALLLSSARAAETLGWTPRLAMDTTISWTADWYRAHRAGADMRAFSLAQIAAYEELLP